MATMTLPDGLLDYIKNALDITWNDAETDTKITGIIKNGIMYLNSTAGVQLIYTEEGKALELLVEYCRYARSGGLDDFQKNYLHELLTLQIQEEVKAYAAEEADSDV